MGLLPLWREVLTGPMKEKYCEFAMMTSSKEPDGSMVSPTPTPTPSPDYLAYLYDMVLLIELPQRLGLCELEQ